MKYNNKVTMKIKKAIGLAVSLAILPASSLFTFTSCEDYLTITPTSSIVEEEFWEDKNDLNNALIGCYKSMTEEAFLNRVIYWGEMRSDNCDRSIELGSAEQETYIMNANLLPTYNVYDWTPMYKTINYCNKVLEHGPQVVRTDESFSEQNWLPMMAEAKTLRALCYFYLVRSFGEIPYIDYDINNDSQELSHEQKTQLTVLNNIIKDLEEVKSIAMEEYGNTIANKGRITKKAVYTLLADVYLWRASYLQGGCHPFINRLENEYAPNPSTANSSDDTKALKFSVNEKREAEPVGIATAEEDYRQCNAYCDSVIDMCFDELNKKLKQKYSDVLTVKPDLSDLLAQHYSFSELSEMIITSDNKNAFNEIFGTGNSDESIFELQFDGATYGNNMTTSLYWNLHDNKVAKITAPKSLFADVANNPNEEIPTSVFTKTDYRRWESLLRLEKEGQTEFDYNKYARRSYRQQNSSRTLLTNNTETRSSTNKFVDGGSSRADNNNDVNFIVYRLSEVYLMKAEALSQISTSEQDLMTAFNYVKEVFRRSNPWAYYKGNTTAASDTLKTKMFMEKDKMESLVMAERQREFLCEGKRWFDLVRYAQRRGDTRDMLTLLVRKYTGNQKAVQAKLADIQSLFSPVYEEELKANYLLYQNGVWEASKTTGRTDTQK